MNNEIDLNELMQIIAANNPMPGAAIGAFGNVANKELDMLREIELLKRKGAMGSDFQPEVINKKRMLNSDINNFINLRNQSYPNLRQEEPISMPIDIDGASAGTPMSQEELNLLLQQLQRMR